ncbi:DUF3572 domain-containing protein [Luteithermobacter gelatinilyticus]|uniref:DUF3572 domain-containing protein n=1 Tax=Luteithermobacter gelatinilyticus TaxID=2582913 RepID=UPI001105FC26|nr:DUF3572 domain-containing protein [Luteithermobacter gelatinilyticus]|tara:strand:- start:8914 stop:9192 length:279 start_codon:yes stop_codon:yes gene_type:complete
MHREHAEVLALRVLTYLAEDGDALTAFLRLSGMTPETLSQTAGEPATLASILDFILQDEKRLMHFCSIHGISPALPRQARTAFPDSEYITHG